MKALFLIFIILLFFGCDKQEVGEVTLDREEVLLYALDTNRFLYEELWDYTNRKNLKFINYCTKHSFKYYLRKRLRIYNKILFNADTGFRNLHKETIYVIKLLLKGNGFHFDERIGKADKKRFNYKNRFLEVSQVNSLLEVGRISEDNKINLKFTFSPIIMQGNKAAMYYEYMIGGKEAEGILLIYELSSFSKKWKIKEKYRLWTA